jgi:phosphonopyruvate decarboxylase
VSIEARELLDVLSARGGVLVGVPCSLLESAIAAASADPAWRFVPATNEGEAVAIAAGVTLAGGDGVAVMQNSGLGHALDPLASLVLPFGVPLPLLVSHRGHAEDEALAHHAVVGRMTHELLALAGIESVEVDGLARAGERLRRAREERRPLALVVRAGVLSACRAEPVRVPAAPPRLGRKGNGSRGARATRQEVVENLLHRLSPGAVVIGTTGHTSRQLYVSGDADTHLYLEGSMGHASAFGVGVSLARPDLDVVVLDGDGAALMHLGNMATAAAFGGPGFRHVILDNGAHASTGAQPTVAPNLSFVELGHALGYSEALSSGDFDSPAEAAEWIAAARGPALLVAAIDTESPPDLPRVGISPRAQAERFGGAAKHGAPVA